MSNTPARRSNNRRPPNRRPDTDIWRQPPPLPDPEPVAASPDPTALIRSLGDPPLGRGSEVSRHLAIVVDRAATLAAALALSAEVLAD